MTRHCFDEYCCPRCGYKTKRKPCMRDHFYSKKKLCPALKKDIELTEEVKTYVLDNRVFVSKDNVDSSSVASINKVVNNFNIQNNFIAKLDTMDKITQFTTFKKVSLLGIEDKIENAYKLCVKKLENNWFKNGFALKIDDLIDAVNEVSSTQTIFINMEDYNIIYDKDCNGIQLYEDGHWENYNLSQGVKIVLEKIKECYWYAYELYLLRQIYSGGGGFVTAKCRELIDEYFKFIGCFDIYPFFWEKSNNEILYKEDDPRYSHKPSPTDYEAYSISEEYGKRYLKTKETRARSDSTSIRKTVFDIIKNNSVKNIKELNKRVLSLFQMDEQFKELLLKTLEVKAAM